MLNFNNSDTGILPFCYWESLVCHLTWITENKFETNLIQHYNLKTSTLHLNQLFPCNSLSLSVITKDGTLLLIRLITRYAKIWQLLSSTRVCWIFSICLCSEEWSCNATLNNTEIKIFQILEGGGLKKSGKQIPDFIYQPIWT